MIEKTLQPGQKEQVHAEGTFIYVLSAPGEVLVEAHPSGYVYPLPPRGQVVLPDGETFSRVSFTNSSKSAGTIKLITGFGRYIPPNDGQLVTLDKSVKVVMDNNLKSSFDGAQPVYFEHAPEVRLPEALQKALAAPITFPPLQQVAVTNQLPFPKVQRVELTNQNPFPDVQKVLMTGTVVIEANAPLSTVITNEVAVIQATPDLSTGKVITIQGAQTLPAKVSRKSVIVIAPGTNQGTVFIQGFIPIAPGGFAEIGAKNMLSITGIDGDEIHYGEMC